VRIATLALLLIAVTVATVCFTVADAGQVERANPVPAKLEDPEKLREVLAHHDQARQFWQDKLAGANAE